MNFLDVIIVVVLALVVVGICLYIRKEKKQGSKCIGCPHAKECSGKCSSQNK